MGSLSNLSSDSDIPFLFYRVAENVFCKAFHAQNLARSDISLDAKKGNIGLGLKTFINKENGSTEKIAEFNKNAITINSITNTTDKIKFVSALRNKRLLITKDIADVALDKMLYHCILREKNKFIVHENPMKMIDIDAISEIKDGGNVISFYDGIYKYSYNQSKSTLYSKFVPNPIYEMDIKILQDPYDILESLFRNPDNDRLLGLLGSSLEVVSKLCLPLYSYKKGKNNFVPEKSGLNQWNAGGRKRNHNEIYIPIPSFINKAYPDFLPSRDESFMLKKPDGSDLKVKVCQAGNKALMSDPNSALGEWLLRKVLKLELGELLTYKRLEEIGIDSVEILKYSDDTYEINFKKLGTFEQFKEQALLLIAQRETS